MSKLAELKEINKVLHIWKNNPIMLQALRKTRDVLIVSIIKNKGL